RLERHVVRLPGIDVTVHDRRERRVDHTLQVFDAAKALAQLDGLSTSFHELLADLPVNVHVGAAKPIDRLLRIADEEQLPWYRVHVLPSRLAGILRSQQEEDF